MFFCAMSLTENQSQRKSPDISDKLIEDLASGDKEALKELYEKTSSAVYGFALSIVANMQDAQDIMQELYIKAYENAPKYEGRGKPMAWLLTITRNLALMKLRDNGRFEQMDDNKGGRDEEMDFGDREALKAALELLSPFQRQAVMLHALSGFKHHECAAVMKIPLSTELSHYHRGIKKLKDYLIKEEEKADEKQICGTKTEKRC